MSACSAPSRTWKTTASVTCRGAARIDFATRFETIRRKPPHDRCGSRDRAPPRTAAAMTTVERRHHRAGQCGFQDRAGHRRRTAERPRFQPAGRTRGSSGRRRSSASDPRRPVTVGIGLRSQPHRARPGRLRPRHRRRLRRETPSTCCEEPPDSRRDHRRRPVDAEGQAGERRGDPLPRGTGRLLAGFPRGVR